MKTFRLKISDPDRHTISGFTLIELLVSISIMGLVASFISFAVSSMINSNQNLGKEQNRRVEASRAIDLIANDVKISKIVPATLPTGVTGATPILSMDIVAGACPDPASAKNRITYFIKPVPAGSKTEIGPNVIYRYGMISGADGNIDCSATTTFPNTTTPANNYTPIADAIDRGSLAEPTCSSSAVLTGTTGFYSCVNNVATSQADSQQVSVALYSKLSGNKIYGINRTITSGFIPDLNTLPTANDCTVPDITSTTKTPNQANTAITGTAPNNLLYSGIDIEVGGTTVLTQNPLAGTKLPCGKGLVTYTY